MAELLDNCRFTAGSSGTAAFADGTATPSFRNLEDAGAVDGVMYPYKAQNATGTEWEFGRGTAIYTFGTWTFERTNIEDSSNGGAAVNFGANPVVVVTAGREELNFRPDMDALFLDQRMTTLIVSEALNTAIFSGPDGSAIHDHFDSLTYVDDENATNLDISEAGALKRSAGTTAPVPGGTGTIFGTTPSANALTAVFDGVTNQAGAACAAATGTNFYVGKTFASPKAVNKVTCHGSNSSGYVSSSNPSTTITLYGKQGSAPASPTNGTSLGSITFTDTANEATGRDITSSDTSTLWDHVWINITIGASGFIAPAELIIHEQLNGGVSVRSTAISASEVPTEMYVLALLYDAAGITLNTDTFIDVSRDGGTTWTQATLIELYTQPGNIRAIYTQAVSVSGQPSGSSLKWRWRTANSTIAAKLLGAAMWGRAS